MKDILHIWTAIWPNLLASTITFISASVWHLYLVRRTLRRHEQAMKNHLDAHQKALNLHPVKEEHDCQRN